MKKWLCGIAIVLLLLAGTCSTDDPIAAAQYEPMSDASAYDFFFGAQDIRAGWNVGNTLDAHRNGVSGETIWGQPRINQALFNGVKAAGFDIVRIPVTWMGHVGPAPDYKIEEAFLERVAQVVDLARNAGLVAIINMHHDGHSPNATSKTAGTWLLINDALADAADKAAITAKFESMWKQIAARFAACGDYLIFESFNELHDGGWYWETRNVPKEQYDLLNEWNQVFTDAVRGTGGNNALRYLVIPGYCTGAEALLTPNFVLPADSAADRLIVSFHYYRPDGFALNGTTPNWGTQPEKTAVETLFARIKEAYTMNRIPVIIGETGPVRNAANTDEARQNRLDYINHMFGQAAINGLVPMYWDNGSSARGNNGFGLFDRATGAPKDAECAAVIEAMISAVR